MTTKKLWIFLWFFYKSSMKSWFHRSNFWPPRKFFDNWYFFNSEEKICDIYNAKNFNISNISLWFFIKYIFGFERIIRLDEFDNADVDLELTVERKLSESENEKENQIEDSQSIPISEYTNEYSPLRYF